MKYRTVWNGLAEEYAEKSTPAMNTTDWRLGHMVVKELLGDVSGKRILDYGCGPGKFSRYLRERGAQVIGVDPSATAIRLAGEKDEEGIDYLVLPAGDLSGIDIRAIDHAVANFVLCTIPDERKICRIAKQIHGRLPKGGSFIICDPHPDSLGHNYVSTRRERPTYVESGMPIKVQLTGMKTTFYDYWRSKASYSAILENAGFAIDVIKEPRIIGLPEETFWKDERVQAPNIIIRAKK